MQVVAALPGAIGHAQIGHAQIGEASAYPGNGAVAVSIDDWS